MEHLPRALVLALIGFGALALLSSLVEGWVLSRRARRCGTPAYDWKATGTSVFITVGRRAMDVVPLAVAMPGAYWLHERRLLDLDMSAWWHWVLLFLGVEFCYYWFHRAAHRVRWFWANHVVHHSPNQFNLSAAYRLGWLSRVGGTLWFFIPLVGLGFAPEVVAVAFLINLLYQFWIHAEWIPKLGVLEGWINTPSAHRVHHGANLEYLDANYGGVLMVFDRLFGTYVPERDDTPVRYGLVEPVTTYNPFKIVFVPWVALAKDVWRGVRQGSPRAVLGYLFGPPGWRPDGLGPTTDNLRRWAQAPSSTQTTP
jgi:sterol desaturase/sphingolipid hydroxylase (fatty acid hydroxylase superfamily)